MLEHLGAYGIDADALGHRAISKGAPGYAPVIDSFGKWILGPDGQIDRAKLGRIVFSNPEALSTLEDIVHPLVRQAVNILVKRSKHKVVVIEAIKLLESDLKNYCNTVWATDAKDELRLQRLIDKRKMSKEDALERIHAQSDQAIKNEAAEIIISNNKSFEDTWKQVTSAWQSTVPTDKLEDEPKPTQALQDEEFFTRRASPKEAQVIADKINQLSLGKRQMTFHDVMEAFGEKAFLFLLKGKNIIGLLGWQVENLVARIDDLYIEPEIPIFKAMKTMTTSVEKSSKELQCEAALMFLPPDLANQASVWKDLGYSARSVEGLQVRAWQEAALESKSPGTFMLFKQLRKDRVLRPV